MAQRISFRRLLPYTCFVDVVAGLCGLCLASSAAAQPTVVPTAEGQLGSMPALGASLDGIGFIPLAPDRLMLGELTTPIGLPPAPAPEFSFLTDMIHGYPDPVPITGATGLFDNVFKTAPVANRNENGDLGAFSFAVDDSMPGTMEVFTMTFDAAGQELATFSVPNLATFPDPSFNRPGVAADNQGRVTVAYTEIVPPNLPQVKMALFNGTTGQTLASDVQVTQTGGVFAAVALLDPAGNRLIVPSSDFTTVRGNIVDTTGATPTVLPEFPISTTPAFTNGNPAVAANTGTGEFFVAWENATAVQGDPINVRARRFDAMGNPIGDDFLVNTTLANAQAQPSVAADPDSGVSVVVWAGDSSVAGDGLDVFAQVYDAMGNPIGGEIPVNTTTAGFQDRPQVRFLPQPDAQGRPQFVVAWRDVGNADGSAPNGTGTGYRCFSIDGLEDPASIFADGFESGDTTSWSDATQ